MLLTPISQVTESAKDEVSMQVDDPAVAQDFSGPTIEDSKRYLVPPGVNEDAYIQPSASLNVTATPFVLAQNGLASGVSVLEPLTDTQHDSVLAHSGLETDFVCGLDMTHRTVPEPISQLIYVAAFSHLSRPRHASPSAAPNSSCSEICHTLSPGKTDLPIPCADDTSNESPNSSLFKDSVSVTFARPVSPLPPSSPGFIYGPMEYSDHTSIHPLPSQSSPVPTSSPPNFFTSSPHRYGIHRSPPTSPSPAEKLTAIPLTVNYNPLKRPRSPEMVATPADNQYEGMKEQTTKKKARYARNTGMRDTHTVSRS